MHVVTHRRSHVALHVLLLCVAPVVTTAHEHAPRVVSPHNADTYSIKTFARFHRWRDLEGDAKVYEIYKYLVDRRTGVYPLGVPAREDDEALYDLHAVRDPVKLLNVHTIGHCGTLGPMMAGLLRDAGVGPTRSVFMPGFNHVVAEVSTGGRWHYVDLDLRGVFRRADGTLASMEEAATDPSLWEAPNSPLFFPLDSLENVRRAYAKERVEHRYGASTGGHAMDFVLRQGEILTRWWGPQGGRWHHHPSYHRRPFPRSIIERDPPGPKCKHASFSMHTHGNGRFVYSPDLRRGSSDFDDGVHHARNVALTDSGLGLERSGEGYAVFEVRTPYIIVPRVGELETTDDDREASVVSIDASGASLELSTDNGLSWIPVERRPTAGPIDLTPMVSGSYGYLLKIILAGEPGEAVVRSLSITTWVQLHPASLPSLRRGRNRMTYTTGDHHGLDSHVLEIRPHGYDREDVLKHLSTPATDFDPERATSRLRGPFVVRVPAPPGLRVAWFSAGGSFRAGGAETRNSMAYAVGEKGEFTTFYTADLPSYHRYWHYNDDVEVLLEEPAPTVFIRYVGDPAVNNVRVYAHCVRDGGCRSSPVVITHAWTEDGVRKTHTARLDGPGSYDVVVEGEPTDDFIELSVPSDRAH